MDIMSAATTIAAAVGAKIIEKGTELAIIPKLTHFFEDRAKREGFERAVSAALTDLGKRYPEHAASFFDEAFLKSAVAGEVTLFFTRHLRPSAERVASVYSKQFSATLVDARNAAEFFLARVDERMKSESVLEDLLNARQIEETNRLVKGLAEAGSTVGSIVSLDGPGGISDLKSVTRTFETVSRDLLDWPQTLGNNEWIDRSVSSDLDAQLSANGGSVTMLLGVPGVGKSALLARSARQCVERGMTVLALKADQLSENITSLRDLDVWLELGMSTIDALERCAALGPTVLFVDQLDALSELVVLRTGRLHALIMLIRRASAIENLHVVTSCRTFERTYDAQLSRIEAAEILLEPVEWAKITEILKSRGVNVEGWGHDFKEMLRLPQCLKIFLRYYCDASESKVFGTYQQMFEHLWREHLFRTPDRHAASELLLRLATDMSEREVLHLPTARYEANRADLDYLASAGVLKYDPSGTQVTFLHQTLFDFSRARAFVAKEGSLLNFALERQTSLFMRPIFWSALNYMRGADEGAYRSQFLSLWNAPTLREHLRLMLIDFAGMQDPPLDFEVQRMKERHREELYRNKVLFAVCGRPAWFNEFKQDVLPYLMERPVGEAWAARPVLIQALPFARDEVLRLLRTYWLKDSEKRNQALATLQGLGQWNEDAANLAIQIIESGEIGHSNVSYLASVVSVSEPALAVRIVSSKINALLVAALSTPVEPPPAPTPDSSLSDQMVAHIQYDARQPLKKIFEGNMTELYDLETIVSAAPATWMELAWPNIRRSLERVSTQHHEIILQYPTDPLMATRFGSDAMETRGEYPILSSTVTALKEVAASDPESYKAFVIANEASESMAVQRLLAIGIAEMGSEYSNFGLDFLLEDPRRLHLENFEENERETKMVIRAIVPHLSAADRLKLEQAICMATEYRAEFKEPDASTRFDRQKWEREFRLRLLLQFPEALLSESGRQHVRTELSAFPNFADEPKVGPVLSARPTAMSVAQMAKATDRNILNFLSNQTDDTGWGDPFDRRSSISASREFAEFAKLHPTRAIPLLESLPAVTHERPVSYALDILTPEQLSLDDLMSIVGRLEIKGFRSAEFRESAASAIHKRTTYPAGLSEDAISLLSRWLSEHPLLDEPKEELKREKEGDSKDTSLLWSHGVTYVVPNGTYPLLVAILDGLVFREPSAGSRVLRLFSQHLEKPDAQRIWYALAYQLARNSHRYDPVEYVRFIDALFSAYPGLLRTHAGIWLVAHSLRIASPDASRRWLESIRVSGWERAPIAFGELLTLLFLIDKKSIWAEEELERLRAGAENADGKIAMELVGVMHGATHLWRDVSRKDEVTKLLTAGLRSKDPKVAGAVLDWYRLDQPTGYSETTRPIFEALVNSTALASARSYSYLVESLIDIVQDAPDLVYKICGGIVRVAGPNLASLSTAVAMDSEGIINIAMALQRMDEPNRTNGLVLFENLVRLDAYRAQDVLRDLDRRPADTHTSPARRPRMRRSRGRRA